MENTCFLLIYEKCLKSNESEKLQNNLDILKKQMVFSFTFLFNASCSNVVANDSAREREKVGFIFFSTKLKFKHYFLDYPENRNMVFKKPSMSMLKNKCYLYVCCSCSVLFAMQVGRLVGRQVGLFWCHTNIQKNNLQYSYRITKNNLKIYGFERNLIFKLRKSKNKKNTYPDYALTLSVFFLNVSINIFASVSLHLILTYMKQILQK